MNNEIRSYVYAVLEKQAAPIGALSRVAGVGRAAMRGNIRQAIKRLLSATSPKVNPGKYNPLRIFTSTRTMPLRAENVRPITAAERAAAAVEGKNGAEAYLTAYGSGAGKIAPGYSEFKHPTGTRETTRVSPGRVLAALGLTGAGGIAASTTGDTVNNDNLSGKKSVIDIIKSNPKLMAALGIGTAGTVGAGIYIASKNGKRKNKDDK